MVALVVDLELNDPDAQLKFPDESVFKNCPSTILFGKVNV